MFGHVLPTMPAKASGVSRKAWFSVMSVTYTIRARLVKLNKRFETSIKIIRFCQRETSESNSVVQTATKGRNGIRAWQVAEKHCKLNSLCAKKHHDRVKVAHWHRSFQYEEWLFWGSIVPNRRRQLFSTGETSFLRKVDEAAKRV